MADAIRNAMTGIFDSNYPWICSILLLIIVILLILIIARMCTTSNCISPSVTRVDFRTYRLPSGIHEPKVHRTAAAPASGSNASSQFVSSVTQLPGSVNMPETTPLLSENVKRMIESIQCYQERQESGGCGLVNFANSCYINSALQCLCHIRSFTDIILSIQEKYQRHLTPISSAYAQLLTKMKSLPRSSTTAYELKACLSSVNQRFSTADQQDSHEFLTTLIEAMHDELMDNYQDGSIDDLMHGTIRSVVKCNECLDESYTDQSFLSLPISVHQSETTTSLSGMYQQFAGFLSAFIGRSISLDDCFERLFSVEQLNEGAHWFCSKCQKLTKVTKTFHLEHVPRVLILQLKRFSNDLTDDTKVKTKVSFKHQLDLQKFMNRCELAQSWLYTLVAVVVHEGTLTSGHYTAFARHLDNECWHHFNDEDVSPASSKKVLTSDAYILVYERR
ncbi:unnamed protein product [Adineta ricciae]|uniref:Ubiquitin carboxyl-terminal hydrolase n=1 Tax=Adineta ricciae TaxID=249248 RepID=A0A814MN62_ADIRI|nr:unnamed protein product [Adineta ricciae]